MSLGLLTVRIFTLCIAQVYQRLTINLASVPLLCVSTLAFSTSLSLPRLGVALRWQESRLDQPQSEPLGPCDSHGLGFNPYSENCPTHGAEPPILKKNSLITLLSFVASTSSVHPSRHLSSSLFFFRGTASPLLSTRIRTNLIQNLPCRPLRSPSKIHPRRHLQ